MDRSKCQSSVICFNSNLESLLMNADNPADLHPATWDPALDAVIAAPKHHKVLFENGQLRVLEVTLEPNDEEPVHHHRWPSVFERTQHRFRSCPPGSVPMAESIRRSE